VGDADRDARLPEGHRRHEGRGAHRRAGRCQAGAAVRPDAGRRGQAPQRHRTVWFSIDFAGLDVPWPYPDDDPHGNFRLEEGDTLEAVVEEYQRECERSRAAIAGAGLDDKAKGKDMDFNLRYALVHMIEETARHCGHLDLLREVTDGRTGQ
jgi:hypothetical protein